MTLTEFLLARIAEDEAEIGPLFGRNEKAGPNGIGWAEVGAISEVLMSGQTRALAECEAKRRLVEYFGHAITQFEGGDDRYQGFALHGFVALDALAPIYADHPDYREEWKP